MNSTPRTLNATPTATPDKPRSSREDVLQFLDSLDSYSASPTRPTAQAGTDAGAAASSVVSPSKATPPVVAPSAEEAQSVLDFLDEITQRSSTPTATVRADPNSLTRKASSGNGLGRSTNRAAAAGASPGQLPRRSAENVRGRASPAPGIAVTSGGAGASTSDATRDPAAPSSADGGWGWSSVWSQASNVVQQASSVVQQARSAAEEQVKTASGGSGIAGGIGGLGGGLLKALGENEQAKKWSEGVVSIAKGAHLDQLGNNLKSTTLKSLTDLLNAVAPPIAEHEVLQVSLSHDMIGYDGVETLVYNALSKVMEQIEGGTLIVNKGEDAATKENQSDDPDERDLGTVEGLELGWKLVEAKLEALVRASFKPESEAEKSAKASSLTVPVTNCPIYIRIQACLAPMPYFPPSSSTSSSPPVSLFFLFTLRDPTHAISRSTMSQAMPSAWLDIPFEENEWVEDIMVNVIREGIEIIGKDYVETRMTAQTIAIAQAREAASHALSTSQGNSAPGSVEQ